MLGLSWLAGAWDLLPLSVLCLRCFVSGVCCALLCSVFDSSAAVTAVEVLPFRRLVDDPVLDLCRFLPSVWLSDVLYVVVRVALGDRPLVCRYG